MHTVDHMIEKSFGFYSFLGTAILTWDLKVVSVPFFRQEKGAQTQTFSAKDTWIFEGYLSKPVIL